MKITAVLLFLAASVCRADVSVSVNNVTVVAGETAVIPCKYETASTNTPKITWSVVNDDGTAQKILDILMDGSSEAKPYDSAPQRTPPLTANADGSLVISATTVNDNQVYSKLRCEVSLMSDGLQAKDLHFLAAVLPEEDPVMKLNSYGADKNGFDITGHRTNVGSCKTSGSYPRAVVTFYRNGEIVDTEVEGLDSDSDLDFFAINNVHKFTEDGVSETTAEDLMIAVNISDHQADFICNIKTVYGDRVFERNYTMPKFNVNYETSEASFDDIPPAILGETITLKCSANGFPGPTISINDMEGAEHQIRVTNDLDAKQYLCTAYNNPMQADRPVTSEPYIMSVISLKKPVITGDVKGEETQIRYGEPASFSCSAEGQPIPMLAWYKGENMVSTSGMLSFPSPVLTDEGDYTCRASNDYKMANETALHVQVNGMNRADKEREDVVYKENEKVTLSCSVDGNPRPMVEWDIDGKKIDNEDASMTLVKDYRYTSQFEVGPFTPEDSKKEYTCTFISFNGTRITKTFSLPEITEDNDDGGDKEITAKSSSTAIIIVILVLILVIAIVLAVLYNKGIICKKSEEKGDESAEGDLEGGMNNEEDVETGNGSAQPADANEEQPTADNPEEEKLMSSENLE